jgi:hypothetical protein
MSNGLEQFSTATSLRNHMVGVMFFLPMKRPPGIALPLCYCDCTQTHFFNPSSRIMEDRLCSKVDCRRGKIPFDLSLAPRMAIPMRTRTSSSEGKYRVVNNQIDHIALVQTRSNSVITISCLFHSYSRIGRTHHNPVRFCEFVQPPVGAKR